MAQSAAVAGPADVVGSGGFTAVLRPFGANLSNAFSNAAPLGDDLDDLDDFGDIGAFTSISSPGSAYVLLHHVMGEAGGARGVWGYVRGGMGALNEACLRVQLEFMESLGLERTTVEDVSGDFGILALQGPLAGRILARLTDAVEELRYFCPTRTFHVLINDGYRRVRRALPAQQACYDLLAAMHVIARVAGEGDHLG